MSAVTAFLLSVASLFGFAPVESKIELSTADDKPIRVHIDLNIKTDSK